MNPIVDGGSNGGYRNVASSLTSFLPSRQTVKKMFLSYLALSGAGMSAARLMNRPAANDVSVMRLPANTTDVVDFISPVDPDYLNALTARYGDTAEYPFQEEESEYESSNDGVKRRALAENYVQDIEVGAPVTQKVDNETQFRFMLNDVTPIRLSSVINNTDNPWPFALSLSRSDTSPDDLLYSKTVDDSIESLSSVFFPGEYYINFGKSQDNRTGSDDAIFFEAKEIDKKDAYAEAGAVRTEALAPALEMNDTVYDQILPMAERIDDEKIYGTACFLLNICGPDRMINLTLYATQDDLNNMQISTFGPASYNKSYTLPIANSTEVEKFHEFLMKEGKTSICLLNTMLDSEITISLGAFGEKNEPGSCPAPKFSPPSPPASDSASSDTDGKDNASRKIIIIASVAGSVVFSLAGLAVIKKCCVKPNSDLAETGGGQNQIPASDVLADSGNPRSDQSAAEGAMDVERSMLSTGRI